MEQQIITGNTRLVGIIGRPVSHSLSPILHNHLFRTLDLPYVYVPLAVSEDDLPMVLKTLRALNFAGANVTIPHKSAVISLCDVISDLSQLTGTVNTLFIENNQLHGTTTDAEGFFTALGNMNHDISGGNVVVLGNGGTARTLGFAMAHEKKIRSLTIIGRDLLRIGALASEITDKTGFPVTTGLFESDSCRKSVETCTLLVNCTSAGMSPNNTISPLPPEAFHKDMAVFDTIYNPAETLFLKHAARAGCNTQNGMRMLINQGLASFKYWTGIEADANLIDINELQSLVN